MLTRLIFLCIPLVLTSCLKCTLEVCRDSLVLMVFQDSEAPIEEGNYTVTYQVDGNEPVSFDLAVGTSEAVLDEEFASEYSEDGGDPAWVAYLSTDRHLVVDFARLLPADSTHTYSLSPDEITVEISSDTTVLGSEVLSPQYERYWCGGGPECADKENYSAVLEMQIDSPPATE